MFGGHTKQRKSSVAAVDIEAEISQIEGKLSRNSRQWKNKINRQEAEINRLKTKSEQLRGLLDNKLLVNAISQAVTTSLKVSSKPVLIGGSGNNGTRYVS